jgi:hypothetical protein
MQHPEAHYIIQAQRGQGKTTLLLKLYYEVRRDETLNKRIVPVIFNEEQYHVSSLFELWSHSADKLEEEDELFLGIYDKIEEKYDHNHAEEEAFKCLESALKEQEKKLLLFIDNVDQLLDKLGRKEQQRLREVLITCPEIRLIGASVQVMKYTYDYSKPFYELFRIVTLEGLSEKQTITLLKRLGHHYKQENIDRIIRQEPGRIKTLRRLTSGVPRTVVLLFEIFVDHENGNAFSDLELVLDRVTPLYKHRMDDLGAQQQKIVHAIALNWDAMAAKEIAEKTRIESKVISSQLKMLEKKRIVHKIPTTTKNYFYQVTERFFNIWYLMRYGGRRGRNRVQWLVRFLECWCTGSGLESRTLRHNSSRAINFKEVKDYYLQEVRKGDTHATKDMMHLHDLSIALLRNDEIEESLNIAAGLLKDEQYLEMLIEVSAEYFILLLSKKQYYAALRLFNENAFELKERLKPVYYAMMHFLQDDCPDEYKKMGEELEQTVEEIIQMVHTWEKNLLSHP